MLNSFSPSGGLPSAAQGDDEGRSPFPLHVAAEDISPPCLPWEPWQILSTRPAFNGLHSSASTL